MTAAETELQELYLRWPGGLDEIDASLRQWKERAMDGGWKHMAADYLTGLHALQANSSTAHNYFLCAANDLRKAARQTPVASPLDATE